MRKIILVAAALCLVGSGVLACGSSEKELTPSVSGPWFVEVDYDKTVEELVFAGDHTYQDSNINNLNFSTTGSGQKTLEMFVVSMGEKNWPSSSEVAEFMKERAYRPANLVELLAFSMQISGESVPGKLEPILTISGKSLVSLGSSWVNAKGVRSVVSLGYYNDETKLFLVSTGRDWAGRGWHFKNSFLAVRQ